MQRETLGAPCYSENRNAARSLEWAVSISNGVRSMSASLPYDRLKPAQRIALLALLRGEDFKSAAKGAGVAARTVQSWRRQPDFQQAFAGAQEDFVKNCPAEVNAARAEAFQALYDVAHFGPAADRVRAASFLLDYFGHPKISPKSRRKPPSLSAVNNLASGQGDNIRYFSTSRDRPDTTPVKPGPTAVQALSSIA